MTGLRQIIRTYPARAMLALIVVLAARLIVPAGFMPAVSGGQIVIAICSGHDGAPVLATIDTGKRVPGGHDPTHVDAPCPYAALTAGWLPVVDPIQLGEAIAVILASGFMLPVALPTRYAARLRPPLRGPPLCV